MVRSAAPRSRLQMKRSLYEAAPAPVRPFFVCSEVELGKRCCRFTRSWCWIPHAATERNSYDLSESLFPPARVTLYFAMVVVYQVLNAARHASTPGPRRRRQNAKGTQAPKNGNATTTISPAWLKRTVRSPHWGGKYESFRSRAANRIARSDFG